jgi:plasmid stability protein
MNIWINDPPFIPNDRWVKRIFQILVHLMNCFEPKAVNPTKYSLMKSLTIHNLDTEVSNAIEDIARRTGLSQNKVIKKLLREALNLEDTKEPRQDFAEFCGLWSGGEAESFSKAVGTFDQIDEEMWQ